MPGDLLNAAEVEVEVVLFDSEQDRYPKPIRARLREVLGTAPAIRPVKQGAPCYSGAAYRPGTTRGLAGVQAVTLLVLDYDHLSAAQLHQLLDRLAGKLYAIHTSYSDRACGPDDRCVRIVLILTRSLTQQEYRVVRAAVVAELGVPADDRAADASRIWFKPSSPPDRADGAFITYASGAPLDPSAYLGPPTPPAAPLPAPGTPITPTPITPDHTPTAAQQPGARTARQVRARLRKVSDPESRELARRMADGAALADAGARNDALWKAMCIAAFIIPDASPEVLVEVAQPSLAAMAAAAPEGHPAPTLQTAAEMAARALQRAAEQGVRVFERGDETEIAVHLVDALATTEPPAHDEGAFWRYRENTGLWETVEDEEVSRTIQRFAGSGVLRDKNTRELRVTASVVRGARELAAARARCPRFFEEAVPGFAFTNGFVRVDGDGLHLEPHASAHRARVGYPFPFDPSARAPRFEQFRAEVFAGDADAAQKNDCLQEFTGACLIGRATRPAKAIVTVGEGRNGKSTYQDIVSASVPESAKSSIPPHYWEQEYYREKLRGVLLNLVPELPKADILRSEAFKAITAGDTIVARAIRKAPVRFRPVAGHLFAANTLPAVDDASRAFWARIIVITFNNVFSVDPGQRRHRPRRQDRHQRAPRRGALGPPGRRAAALPGCRRGLHDPAEPPCGARGVARPRRPGRRVHRRDDRARERAGDEDLGAAALRHLRRVGGPREAPHHGVEHLRRPGEGARGPLGEARQPDHVRGLAHGRGEPPPRGREPPGRDRVPAGPRDPELQAQRVRKPERRRAGARARPAAVTPLPAGPAGLQRHGQRLHRERPAGVGRHELERRAHRGPALDGEGRHALLRREPVLGLPHGAVGPPAVPQGRRPAALRSERGEEVRAG